METNDFTVLYAEYKKLLERYIHNKISNFADAEDVIQDVLTAAYKNFGKLSEAGNFRQWLIGIASNKCKDYYTNISRAKSFFIPFEDIETELTDSHGFTETMMVRDVLKLLPDKEKQILYLYYIRGFNQADIAKMLNIPVGTVKSRMSKAKSDFKEIYSHDKVKGDNNMKHSKFPQFMPKFNITKSENEPFSVICEEISGWLAIPRVGEKSSFAFYDDPDGILTGVHTMSCVSNAEIHGISCVKVDIGYEADDSDPTEEKSLYIKLTDTHCSYIAASGVKNGAFYFTSFFDEEWKNSYEVGENNIGSEILIRLKNVVSSSANNVLTITKEECPDIIGRYNVEINGKTYDTIGVIELCDGIMTILYINESGRKVLFRRYNRYDWKHERYGYSWNEKLPDSEKFTVNGELYVHWYDCIPDFIL